MKLLLSLLLFASAPALAMPPVATLAIYQASIAIGVPEPLLLGICQAESNLDVQAIAIHDGGPSNTALGMCQILLSTAREFITPSPGCYSPHPTTTSCNIMNPVTNTRIAARIIRRHLLTYKGSWTSAIAAYNAGTVKPCTTGWVRNSQGKKLYTCVVGNVLNQRYVDRVLYFIAGVE